jgi:hypothetical protein
MSWSAAIAEVQSQLGSISGLEEYADQRVDTLATAGGGKLDGVYLLRFESTASPWAEDVGISQNAWYGQARLEICSQIHNDELNDTLVRLESLGRQAIQSLLITSLTSACILNQTPPRLERFFKDRRVLWVWEFWVRYTES